MDLHENGFPVASTQSISQQNQQLVNPIVPSAPVNVVQLPLIQTSIGTKLTQRMPHGLPTFFAEKLVGARTKRRSMLFSSLYGCSSKSMIAERLTLCITSFENLSANKTPRNSVQEWPNVEKLTSRSVSGNAISDGAD
ncbi:MAG: hypothetical protein AAF483_13815 [Planctomycetota bacterium]